MRPPVLGVGRLAVGGRQPVGYYKDPEKSAATFQVVDGVRYSIPGDWAEVLADGQRLAGQTRRLRGRTAPHGPGASADPFAAPSMLLNGLSRDRDMAEFRAAIRLAPRNDLAYLNRASARMLLDPGAADEALEDRGVDDIVHLGTVEAQEGDTLPMLVVDRLAH